MAKIARIFLDELRAILQWLVMHLPHGYIGTSIRRRYWGARLRNRKLAYIGFGARIHHCHLLALGENFTLGDYAAIEAADSDPVYIGNNVGIANGAYLRSANHAFEDLSRPICSQGHSSKHLDYRGRTYSIVIEDNVWLAAKTVVLTGAFIGQGSIVAAGSVVATTIPPYSIVAGNPARVIANRKKMAELKQSAGEENARI